MDTPCTNSLYCNTAEMTSTPRRENSTSPRKQHTEDRLVHRRLAETHSIPRTGSPATLRNPQHPLVRRIPHTLHNCPCSGSHPTPRTVSLKLRRTFQQLPNTGRTLDTGFYNTRDCYNHPKRRNLNRRRPRNAHSAKYTSQGNDSFRGICMTLRRCTIALAEDQDREM